MSLIEAVIGPIGKLLDKIIPDPQARDRAKLELLQLQGTQEMEALKAQLSAILAEAGSTDPWTSRARPSFLYVMYVIILWAISAAGGAIAERFGRPGEQLDGDDLLATAGREFEEETGHTLRALARDPAAPPIDLGSVVQASGKRVHPWRNAKLRLADFGACDAQR